jgi:hypothetical protein
MVQYPLEGTSTPLDHIILFFLGPLGGQTEPMFPFLFVAFIGSILGLGLTTRDPSPSTANKGIKMGTVMFVLGGLWIPLMYSLGLDSFGNLVDNTFVILKLPIWLPLMLFITGGNLIIVSLCLRMVEFRGKGKKFAERMSFFRRFGIVSLTVFTFQYFDMLPRYAVSLIPGVNVVSERVDIIMSFATIAAVLLAWDVLLRIWSKAKYMGSAEWLMGTLMRRIMGARSEERSWYDLPKLGLMSRSGAPDWIELPPKKTPHRYDSKLSLVLSIFGFLFFPLSIISLRLSKYALRKEGRNLYNRMAAVMSWMGIVFFVSWTIAFSQIRGIVIS